MTNTISTELNSVLVTYAAGGTPDLFQLAALSEEDISRVAMLRNLELVFSPMSADTVSKAAAQLLMYTKARPASRIDARVGTAEEWLLKLEDNTGNSTDE